MLEKEPWSSAPNGLYSSTDGDSIKEGSSQPMTLKNNIVNSSYYEFCGNVAILGDKITYLDNNSFSDPLSGINHTGNNLNFFEKADKDSSDFLYFGWPEIDNFEDVNRMFSSCDSTFGLGAGNENELDWFSSADNIGGSEDIMNSDFKFSHLKSNPEENISPDHDSSNRYSFNKSTTKSANVRLKDTPWMSEKSDSYMSCANEPAIAQGNEEIIPHIQINQHQEPARPLHQSEGNREDPDFGNDCVSYMNKFPDEAMQLPSRTTSQACPSVRMPQQLYTSGSDHSNYLQNHLSYTHSDYSPLSDMTSVNPTSSAVTHETSNLTSISPINSSHASCQFPSMDGYHDSPLPVTAPTGTGKREKLHKRQGGQSSVDSSPKHTTAMLHAGLDDPGPLAKEAQYLGAKPENHSDTEGGSLFIQSELDSSNVQESSTMSSGIDDVSQEAASFSQLQLVMEQLDLRTKICIRDSLYRLARSAEQRHNQANLSGICGDICGENKFIDIETDTNEIDRSIAHLLFHRPSESSPMPAQD